MEEGNDVLRNLIAQSDTAGALQWLQSNGHDVAMLQSQWESASLEYEKGRIKYKEFVLVQNRINYSLLHFFDPEPPAPPALETPEPILTTPETPVSEEDRAAIRQLLADDHLMEAVDYCKNFGGSYALIVNRFNSGRKHYLMGLIDEEDWALEQGRIRQALFLIAE